MSIDIRAICSCSLGGTLISASISDDYVQGTGLIKVKGSCEISGIITPAMGTAVTFSYISNGVTRQVPRKLRVLSSFADPFRRTTKVELGCKLTYLSDLKEPIDWSAFDDPANASMTEDDARIITIPINASSVMDKCLDELGLTCDTSPLTNQFSIATFDFSPGYVQVLSDLLVSESYCGYLDSNEKLVLFTLAPQGGAGPVVDATKIIDLGPIGVGQLPGEAVTVSYSTLKLDGSAAKTATDASFINWEKDISASPVTVPVRYTSASGVATTELYAGIETTVNYSDYRPYYLETGNYDKNGKPILERKDLVATRIETVSRLAASVAGTVVAQYLANGEYFNGSALVDAVTTTNYTYDAFGNVTRTEETREEEELFLYGSLALPMVFPSGTALNAVSYGNALKVVSRTITRTKKAGNCTSKFTEQYGLWNYTIQGQQTIAESKDNFATATDVEQYVSSIYAQGLCLLKTRVDTNVENVTSAQERPSGADLTNSQNASGGDPNNGWRTSSTSDLALALGSATAQRRIEFSLPYAPDDVFYGPSGGPYNAILSDAAAKAKLYGQVQNALLLGNRSGMNLQIEASRMPSAPFSPLIVQANGLSAMYRTNGTSWQLSAEGILASTDALFYGAVGGTGVYWFPVAPGITTLPTTPPVVDGSMTVASVVPVWNETVLITARTSTKVSVTSLSYALELLTELIVPVYTQLAAQLTSSFYAPVADAIDLSAVAPSVTESLNVRPTVADSTIETYAPQVGGAIGIYAAPSVADLLFTASAPNVGPSLQLRPSAAVITLSAYAPVAPGSLQLRPAVSTIAQIAPVPLVGRLIGVYADPAVAVISITAPAPTRA